MADRPGGRDHTGHRGQGLGTEAARAILDYGFEQLNLSRLICLVDRENLASIKVARNIGMTFEKAGEDEKGPFLLYSISKLPGGVNQAKMPSE